MDSEIFHTDRNVTELLFHPANFKDGSTTRSEMNEPQVHVDHFRDLVSRIQKIYRRIGSKLNSWRNNKSGNMKLCDSSANTEICNLGEFSTFLVAAAIVFFIVFSSVSQLLTSS
jgi:hypothetical protein